MVKRNTVKLNVKNNTPFPMMYHGMYFGSGRVADNFSWPKVINKNENYTIVCYERDWAVSGCSGFVQYVMNGNIVTIAFSNPSAGTNKVGVGVEESGKSVWDNISSHDYQEFTIDLKVGHAPIMAHCKCSGGTTNDASVVFHLPYSYQQDHQQNNLAYPPGYTPYP